MNNLLYSKACTVLYCIYRCVQAVFAVQKICHFLSKVRPADPSQPCHEVSLSHTEKVYMLDLAVDRRFKGTGTRDYIFLKVVSLDRS